MGKVTISSLTVPCVQTKLLQSCLSLCDPMDCGPPGSSVHEDSPGKNTGVGFHALLQRIFLTQGLNPRLLCLLHRQAGSLPLVPEDDGFCLNLVSLLGSGFRMLPTLLLIVEMKNFWLLVIYALPWSVLETLFLYEE